MLPPELVRARRSGDALRLTRVTPAERQRARELSEDLISTCRAMVDQSEEELGQALSAVERSPREEKLFQGLKKLTLDACDLGAGTEMDAVLLRKLLFTEASRARFELSPGEQLRRDTVLLRVAESQGLTAAQLDEALFADLKGAARLRAAPELTPEELVSRWELAQVQGILLRAVRLEVRLRARSPLVLRSLLSRLRFRQLLLRVEDEGEGKYRLLIDGPFSLVDSVTRYGLALALVLPVLLECEELSLRAELRWGKERERLTFELTERPPFLSGVPLPELRPELLLLLSSPVFSKAGFTVRPAEALLSLPGVGVVVPDLVFQREGGPPVFLELLGYFSREAVFRRLDWAQASREHRVVFAASSRLRVSEDALPEETPAGLCVFKGALTPRQVLEKVEEALERPFRK